MKKILSFCLALQIIFALTISPFSHAQEETYGDFVVGMGKNIGRGLWNVASSPAEIPCTMRDDAKELGAKGYGTGFVKGMFYVARRAVIGVCEVGTFIFPSYPVIKPVCHQDPERDIVTQ